MSPLRLFRDWRARTLLVPEVLQTSMMDCGPATLKSVFDGFRRPINLERLRERCQTDVDGTSLAAMRETAERLGLDVEQAMVPKDSLLLDEADCLPAIVVVANPEGLFHFVTLWSRHGGFVQVMDPARGRVWIREEALLRDVATPQVSMSEQRWRAWASESDFSRPLLAKMRAIGLSTREASALLERAMTDPSYKSLAALDAATRFMRSLIDAGALPRGAPARQLLVQSIATHLEGGAKIPEPYWMCAPGNRPGTLVVRGALVLTIRGALDEPTSDAEDVGAAPAAPLGPRTLGGQLRTRLSTVGVLPADLGTYAARATRVGTTNVARQSMWAGPVVPRAVLTELRSDRVRPHRIFARMLWDDSKAGVILLGALMVLGVGTGVLDAVLMRGLSDILGRMNIVAHRIVAVAAVLVFLVLALVLDLAEAHLIQRLARGLETRFRVAFLEKLPKLEDRYFRSRPVSDMASRAHLLQTLRGVPRFVVDTVAGVLRVLTTSGVIVWLEPRLWRIAVVMVVLCLSLPFVSYRLIDEALAKTRVLGASLYRFYLDALLGVVPIRVHGAERSVRREHEGILAEWVRAALSVERRALAIRGAERVIGTVVAIVVVVMFLRVGGDIRALLLIAFFAQRLPGEAEALVSAVRRYPLLKHDALRLFEPLAAAEETTIEVAKPARRGARSGVEIVFKDVTAVAGGRSILTAIDVTVRAGEHVAIVGPSGAGKSSLVGVLLGWLFLAEGRVLVDRRPLDAQRRAQLRQELAWVDPAVQLWNQTLLENLLYGHGDEGLVELEGALAAADLLEVVDRTPDGLQGQLGEGGARVSGGQGQRVRVGRALLSRDARLAILDEPFRGLERDKRRELLKRARERWRSATLLFVSHDVGDTVEMDRVLVVEGGEVVEDGAPADLLARDTRYRRLVERDRAALDEIWGRSEWRRLKVEDGRLVANATRRGAAR